MTIPFFFGLTLQNNISNPTKAIDILPGGASALDDLYPIHMPTFMTKRLDLGWSSGDGNGMLDTGSPVTPSALLNGATYHLFLIADVLAGETDVLASTSPLNPSLPAGWEALRPIGSVLVDEVGNIRPFIVKPGRWFELITPVRWATNLAVSTIAYNHAVGSPVGVKTLARLGFFGGGAANYFTACDPDGGNATQAKSIQYIPGSFGFTEEVMTDASGKISIRSSANCTISGGYLNMWKDFRDEAA